jgi:hypothetical protein
MATTIMTVRNTIVRSKSFLWLSQAKVLNANEGRFFDVKQVLYSIPKKTWISLEFQIGILLEEPRSLTIQRVRNGWC